VIYAPVAMKAVTTEFSEHDSLPQETGVSFGELTIQLLSDLAQKHCDSSTQSEYETPEIVELAKKECTSQLLDSVSEKLCNLTTSSLEDINSSSNLSYFDWSGDSIKNHGILSNNIDRSRTLPSIASKDMFHVQSSDDHISGQGYSMPGSFYVPLSNKNSKLSVSARSITPSNPLPTPPTQTRPLPTIPVAPLPPQRGLRTLDLEKQDRRRWTIDYSYDKPPLKKKSLLDFFSQFV
jgi:hypothetical protein